MKKRNHGLFDLGKRQGGENKSERSELSACQRAIKHRDSAPRVGQ